MGDREVLHLEVEAASAELKRLESEATELDTQLHSMQVQLRQLSQGKNNCQLAFVTRQDLQEVESDDDTFFVAIRAPIGTTLNVMLLPACCSLADSNLCCYCLRV